MHSFLRIIAAVAFAVMSSAGIGGVAVAAPAGSITGFVTDNNGTAIEGATVSAYDWPTLDFEGVAYTSVDGAYSITGLSSGSYHVMARATGYSSEYWNEASTRVDADLVTVTDPSATSDINFTLTPGSFILGHVYRADGTTPIPNAQVMAYDNVNEPGTWEYMAGTAAKPDGSYSITAGLGAGSYLVMARGEGYAAEYYDNVSTQGAATPVVVTADNDTTGINFTLTQTGYISGTVYQADGVTPLGGVTIRARDNTTQSSMGYAHSAGSGFYYINLPPGTYRLMAEASGYVTEWYLNADTFGDATPISVDGVNETPNKNFSLLPVG